MYEDLLFCAWCEKVYNQNGEEVDIPYELGKSHGICNTCKQEMGKEVSQRKKLKGFERGFVSESTIVRNLTSNTKTKRKGLLP